MKNTIKTGLLLLFLSSCSKEQSGICYCTFPNGEKKEYDLKNLSTTEQNDECSSHDNSASVTGGSCELK